MHRSAALFASLAFLACAVFACAPAARSADAPADATNTPAPVNPMGMGANWRMIRDDEFDGTTLNPNNWAPYRADGPVFDLPYNPPLEQARYSPNNVSVSNGQANLKVTRGPGKRFKYRSGVIQSSSRFTYTYGYVEARIKLPRCDGCWPAFWALQEPSVPNQLSRTEVDVFEFFGTQRFRHPYFNFHWNTFGAERGIERYGSPRVDYTKGYHTYGLYWDRDSMQVYVDGHPGPAMTGSLIPNVPMYLIINLAVERGFRPKLNSQMSIDYVRAWQRP